MGVHLADISTAAVLSTVMFRSITSLHYRLNISAVMYLNREGGVTVKRVKSACILQTLIFTQKPEMCYSRECALEINKKEIAHYEKALERAGTKYQIVDTTEQDDGSIVVRVRKQYSDKVDVYEYFA